MLSKIIVHRHLQFYSASSALFDSVILATAKQESSPYSKSEVSSHRPHGPDVIETDQGKNRGGGQDKPVEQSLPRGCHLRVEASGSFDS